MKSKWTLPRRDSGRAMTASTKYPHLKFKNGIWKGPTVSYEHEDYQAGKRLLKIMKETPDFIGQIDSATGQEHTFADMIDRSIRCALWLKERGIGRGDVISIGGVNHMNTVIPILAGFYIGCTVNTYPSDWLDDEQIIDFLDTLEPKAIFTDEILGPRMVKHNNIGNRKFEVVLFKSFPGFQTFEEILQEHNAAEVEKFQCADIPSEEDTAFLAFTSGSTGTPKVHQYSYKLLKRDLRWIPKEHMHEQTGTWCTEAAWLIVVISALSSIINRSTYVVHRFKDASSFCKVIEKYKLSWMMLGVEHISVLARLPNPEDYDLSSVEFIRYCGSYIRPEIEKKLHAMFPQKWLSQSYGLTEFGLITQAMKDHECPSSGIPPENVEIKLMNSENEIVMHPKQTGELWARTPGLSIVYFKNPTASMNTIDSDGWFHTGDLGYYNEHGEFFIVDRIKQIIRFHVADVYASVVEDCLLKHPAVHEVAVVPKLHDVDIEQPMAFIVKKPYVPVTEEEIESWVEKHLPDRMKLRGGVKFIEEMPYNNSGKLDKAVLRRWCNSP